MMTTHPNGGQGGAISPVPPGVASSSSSPGSASDHMGGMPLHPPNPFLATQGVQGPFFMNGGVSSASGVPRVVSALAPEAIVSDANTSGAQAATTTTAHLFRKCLSLPAPLPVHTSMMAAAASTNSAASAPMVHIPSPRGSAKPTPRRRPTAAKMTTAHAHGSNALVPKSEPNRRQKRLERNRESARLSRRRRKQYLEELEDKVILLGHEVDSTRRAHAGAALATLVQKRHQLLNSIIAGTMSPSTTAVAAWLERLELGLSRTSPELAIMNTFQTQQLRSLSLPPSTKFILWLTLQDDAYFRGGRAASERLSAARIGERMLHSGTDHVTPSQAMWPLFCHEVGLSYDQEEKVRAFQRHLLQTPESWLDRHTAFASTKVVQSSHDALQALALRFGQRELSGLSILSAKQRLAFLSWSQRHRGRIAATVDQNEPPRSWPTYADSNGNSQSLQPSDSYHVAANLYILNHHCEKVLEPIPRAAPLVTGAALKGLMRRPLFESLGCVDDSRQDGMGMSREDSFASSSSLKRSAPEFCSSGSLKGESGMEDDERPPSVSPEEAQVACSATVEAALGFIREIIPPPPTPPPVPPGHVAAHWDFGDANQLIIPDPTPVLPVPITSVDPAMLMAQPGTSKHQRNSSFLPPFLNVVPEEMWPVEATDELLMNLMDEEDWAIGEGVDMEM